MSASRTKEVITAFIAHQEWALRMGRLTAPDVMFDAVMKAANNPLAFSGDVSAARALIDAISYWEAHSTLSTPFPHPNLTWVPSYIGSDNKTIVASLIDATAAADADVLSRFFVPADRNIISGWVEGSQSIHELFLTNDQPMDRYCLLDPMNDCRITRYPSGHGSQPALEVLEAARLAGTSNGEGLPNIPIADTLEPYEKVRKLGWHMDLARVEAARILLRDSQASRHIGTGAERLLKRHKMPTVPVRSYSRFRDICRYVEEQVSRFGHGFSVWYRGQPSSYKRDRSLGIDQAEWAALLGRLKKRLHYLEDDDLLLPALYRQYSSVWEDGLGVREQFQSFAAWQLVSNQMLFDFERFPTAPDVMLAEEVPDSVLALLENAMRTPHVGLFMKATMVMEPGRPDSLQDFEPWTHHYVVLDGKDHFIFKRTHREAQRNASSTLLLQHYGCPTGGLDITSDPERAAMFALGGFVYGRTGAISRPSTTPPRTKPCVYIMLFKDDRDPFLRSSDMYKDLKDDNRIVRQKCGILFGSSWACRNFAQRYIALRLDLGFDLPSAIDPRIVYPTMDEDPISRSIVEKFSNAYSDFEVPGAITPSEARFPPSFVTSW